MMKRFLKTEHFTFNSKTVFFPVFMAALCCSAYYESFSFELNSRYNGIVSWNSMENMYTNARVILFANCLIMGTVVFLATLFLLNFLNRKFRFVKPELKLLNFTSLFGVLATVYILFSPGQLFSIRFLFGITVFILLVLLLHIIFRKKNRHVFNYAEFSIWSLLTGFLIYLIVDYLWLLYYNKHLNPITENIFYLGGAIVVVAQVLFVFTKITFTHLKKHLHWLVWFALHTFVTNEVVYSLNQHGVACHPLIILLSGFLVILCISYFFIIKKGPTCNRYFGSLQKLYFPITLCIVVLHGYFLLCLPNPHELFETANPANAMMRTFVFHEIPFLDYINSHMLSETFFGYIYIALNGYSGTMEFSVYDYMFFVVYILIAYYWLREITGDGALAFGFALFFPFLMAVLSGLLCVAFVSVFLLKRVWQHPSIKNYLLNFFWMFFLLLWRLDAGVSNLTAQTVLLLIIALLNTVHRKNMLKALLLFIGGMLILLLAAWLLQPNLFVTIKQALFYFKSNQAFGTLTLGDVTQRLFVVQHILFPAVFTIMALWTLVKYKQFKNKHFFLWMNVIFFIVFFFSNYQRGIVCHGFNVNTDGWLASFSFLIFGLFALLLVQHKSKTMQQAVFIVSLFLAILIFKFPDCKGYLSESDNFYTSYLQYKPFKKTNEKILRYIPDQNFELENYYELNDFLKTNFSAKATFLDFSNTPILYFYTSRQVPSYFNQYLQNTPDEYLQKENLKKLSGMDVPVVVYANVPKTWFDFTDGVENSARYFLVAEHIYQNYHPFILISKHTIWIKNGLNLNQGNYQADTISIKPQLTALRKLAYLEGIRAANYNLPLQYSWKNSDISKFNNHYEIAMPASIDKTSGNYLEFELENTSGQEMNGTLILQKDSINVGSFHFVVMNKTKAAKYRIRISTQYAWYAKQPNRLVFIFDNEAFLPEISSIRLLKAQYSEN
ncbi:MAG: hypothetical protein WCQ95_14430 [Bacteroidota bacterium]